MEREQLSAEILRLRRELKDRQTNGVMIGCSEKIRQVIEMAPSTANSRQQVLVRGARDRTQ